MAIHVRVLAAALATSVRGAREDVIGFQKAAAIAGIIRARLAGGIDPQDGTPEAVWQQRLGERFAAELAAKSNYDMFRLIEFSDGRELVRVDRYGDNGAIRIVPDDQLQSKTGHVYFTTAAATPLDQIYVSPLELSLATPRRGSIPVLRVAAIVPGPDQKPFGMVMINVDMRPVLRELATSPQPGGQIFIVDERGNYLVHPDPARRFAVDQGKPGRWQDDFPQLAGSFASDDAKTRQITGRDGEQALAGLQSVTLAGGPRVAVIESTPAALLNAPITAVAKSTALVGLIAVLCATGLAFLLARSLTQPLVQMTRAAEAFSRGQSTAIPAASGEVGVLARAFAHMMTEAQDKTVSLEKEIAEHRRTEAELQRHSDRERLLSAAVRSSNDSIITLTPEGLVTSWNPAAERLFGWTAEEMFGCTLDRLVPKDRIHELRYIFDTIARGENLENYETVRLGKSGSEVSVSLSVAPIRLSSGTVVGACSLARDVTGALAAKERLEREIARRRRITEVLDNTINSMADAVLVGDQDGNIVLSNPAAQRLMGIATGMNLAQLRTLHEIFMADGVTPLPLEQRPLMRAIRGESFENYEFVVRLPAAKRAFIFSAAGGPLRRGAKTYAGGVVVYHDVTEGREIERQLRQAQKMDSVGQLTGGVAHDFNNILTVITGTIEILEEGVADRPELAAIAKMIDEASQRGSELTRNLLAFSRRQPLQPRKTNVSELVMETARLLRPTLGESIEIESMLDDDASPALVDPSQLSTSLLNLAINARDAMPNGGKLIFETHDIDLDQSYADMNPDASAGSFVMIAVSDNGAGIPAAIIDKVFEPFFTTKEHGKGTGLGLSMVYGFVKQSGGHIKIYSEEGHGTAIKMYLPRATAQAAPAAEAGPIEPTDGGYETILIVEDDALVRTYVIAQVKSLGYKTLSATNAVDALALIDSDAHIDLLFTDIVMPGMNGRQLADEACKRRPELKVLFTCGYTENAIVHHGRLDPGVLLLTKPYRKQQLAQMIRAALSVDSDADTTASAGATRKQRV